MINFLTVLLSKKDSSESIDILRSSLNVLSSKNNQTEVKINLVFQLHKVNNNFVL